MADYSQRYNCIFCKESKEADKFSERQQTLAKKRCIDCTQDSRVSHYLCRMCGKNLTSDKFSIKQRRMGSKRAVCKNCVKNGISDGDSNSSDDGYQLH